MNQSDEDNVEKNLWWENFSLNYYLSRLLLYKRFLVFLFVVFAALTTVYYMVTKPVYTAQAIVGPPIPTPTSALFGNVSSSVSGGLASKLMGGGNSNFFSMFQQMLGSARLVHDLADKDKLQNLLFENKNNQKAVDGAGKGGSGSPLHTVANGIKALLNRPTDYDVGYVRLSKYLQGRMSISQAKAPGGSMLSTFASNNDFVSISLAARSPEVAEKALSIILSRADNDLRHDQQVDIRARIGYINEQLKHTTYADQKDILINILNSQQQLDMMTVADKRFSYIVVSTPHAFPQPTKPGSFGQSITRCFMLAVLLWLLITGASLRIPVVERFLNRKLFCGNRSRA